jgi:Tfp pilus assembly protein PilF
MSEGRDIDGTSDLGRVMERAERAAVAGDLATAEELLRTAAALQEAQFGPLHPDLANTFNNLGIVAEKLERPVDAEAFYRRAVAIASFRSIRPRPCRRRRWRRSSQSRLGLNPLRRRPRHPSNRHSLLLSDRQASG